jgi:pyruvate/2-oxoglutarate dehydrogenase complex dihydrolipoamide dehydrogenase (E3) component
VTDAPAAYDVIVIGAGPAGTAAALRAAELGASVAVLEASRTGGTCVNTGCVPTRVLAKTARLMRDVRAAADYGIQVGEPRIKWASTVEHVRSRVDRVRGIKNEAERFAAAGIELILEGRARFVDATTLELDSGHRVTGSSILICVGGHSRLLPIPGAELATVPEHVLDLPDLPRRVAVIGGGNTGAQLTTILDSFGSAVTLFDVAPRILMASDEDISSAVAAAFERQCITVHAGIEAVESLERAGDGAIALNWRAGGIQQSSSFDAVIMATGWPADLADLGLEHAGVEVVRSAIAVDQYFRSSVPHIYAVGDANGGDMLVQAAVFEGEAAAENAVLDANRRTPHLGPSTPVPTSREATWRPSAEGLLPAGGFTDPDYAGVGLTETQARERDPQCIVVTVPYAQVDRAVIDDRTTGFLKLIADRRRELILGAHAVGENAIEVVQSVTTAMAAGIDVASLGGVKFAYPTYSAVIGMAARALLAQPAESQGTAP